MRNAFVLSRFRSTDGFRVLKNASAFMLLLAQIVCRNQSSHLHSVYHLCGFYYLELLSLVLSSLGVYLCARVCLLGA